MIMICNDTYVNYKVPVFKDTLQECVLPSKGLLDSTC